jgi:hypothetical protein
MARPRQPLNVFLNSTASSGGSSANPAARSISHTILRAQAPAAVEQVTGSLPKGCPAEVADTISNGIKARLRRMEEAC